MQKLIFDTKCLYLLYQLDQQFIMSVKKIVIAPGNKKAHDFFDDMDRKKEEMRRKAEESPVVRMMKEMILKNSEK